MDTRVWHQVGLELRDINVQSTIETKGGSERTDDLGDQTIQVGVGRLLDSELTLADIVQGFVIEAECYIGVFQKGVGGKHRVVRFYNSSRDLRTGRHSEGKLGLAAVINRKTFQQEGTETGSGTSSSGVEDKETLESGTGISKLSDAIQDLVDDLLSGGVVSTGVVIGGIFLSRDDLFGMVKLGVSSGADFVAHSGFQIHKDSTGDVLSRRSFAEEGVVRVIGRAAGIVGWHFTVRGNAVLQAVEFPAVVTDLDTGLTEMD